MMLTKTTNYILMAALFAGIAAADTQLAIRTTEPSVINIDGGRRGIATAVTPLKVAVTPGQHVVAAEPLVGIGKQELQVEAEANATTYVHISVGGSRPAMAQPSAPGSGAQPVPVMLNADQQKQTDLARQRQELQTHQLETELTDLERRQAAAETMLQSAQDAKQNCQNQQQGPAWLGALQKGVCMLADSNIQKARELVRQIQVEVAAKQRELQRLDRNGRSF